MVRFELSTVEAAPAGEGELNRIFVGNLPFKMTEDWLKQTIESAGTVKDIDWLMHADTGKWKGSVFCTMESAAEASAAAAKLCSGMMYLPIAGAEATLS